MAAEVRFTDEQKRKNHEDAASFVQEYNRDNADTVARYEPLPNGNYRLFIEKKDLSQAILEEQDRNRS